MADINIRTQSSRSQVMQQPQGQGWLRRAISTVRDALTGPTSTRSVTSGPDTFQSKTQVHVNRPRQLNAMNAGRGADSSRGLQKIVVSDDALLPFLDDMSIGKYG